MFQHSLACAAARRQREPAVLHPHRRWLTCTRQIGTRRPPIIPHFLFDRLTLGGIEAAAAIGGAELDAAQSALANQLLMRQAAELAAVMALDRLLMIVALFAAHDAPTPA